MAVMTAEIESARLTRDISIEMFECADEGRWHVSLCGMCVVSNDPIFFAAAQLPVGRTQSAPCA